MVTATTPDGANTAREQTRDGNGRFRREVTLVRRDAQAAEMAAKGWTYDQIAAEMGYADRGSAWRGVQRALAEAANTQGLAEARQKQLTELALLKRQMWAVVDDPGPAFDKLGRVVHDDNGEIVPDQAARANAAAVLLRVAEREARLQGLDAPKRSVTFTQDMVSARIAELKQQLGLDDESLSRLLDSTGRPGLGRLLPGAVEDA